MTLQQLRYVIALDQERHFARAAEACMVSQPGLTIQLKNLEEEIGIKIFDRTKTPLTPTHAGEEIIRRARKILKDVDDIRDYIILEKDALEGEITLGVIHTLSPYLMPSFISEIRKVTPNIHYNIKENSTIGLMDDLETGSIDIALMATPTGRPNLREHVVFNEPFVAYLNSEHPMAAEPFYQLNDDDSANLLLLKDEYCYNAQLLSICNLPPHPDIADQFSYEISSIETLKNLVRAELGFAIIPQLSTHFEAKNDLFKPFPEPRPVREISLVVTDTFSRKLLLEHMSKVLWSCLPDTYKENFKYRKIEWNDSPYFISATKNK